MALPNNDRIDQYTAVGSETQFAYTFPVNAAGDIVVKRNVSGTITTLTLTTDYTVTSVGSASGGQIALTSSAYPSGATAGHKFTIYGNQIVTRAGSSDFSVGGDFFAATINTQLDDLTQIAQDLRRDINLSVKKDPAILDTLDPLLPALTDRRTLVVNEVSSGNFSLVMSAKDPDTQEALAAAQVALATTQATNAATSASAASTSASNAATSETNTATLYDNFDDRFLGAKTSDPTVDNDGDALIDGALFFRTDQAVMKVYDLSSTTWLRTTPSSSEQTAINTVSGIASDVTAVAGKATEIGRLGTADAVADMAILGTADVVADMNTLGTADVVADMNVLGTADVVSDMNTLATADIVSDMNTLATADVVNDMNVLGTAANVTAMNTLGTAANVTAMSNCSGSIANINTTASNIADVNNFAEVYRIASADPTTSLNEGDLVFRTDTDTMRVYNGSAWQNVAPVSAVNVFGTLAVSGQSDIVADSTTDTLTFAGSNITITTDASTDTVTFTGPTPGASTGLAIAMAVAL